MRKVKISIIVPAYNVDNYISECLDSLVNQSLAEIEIIMVDDCSTDHTKSIIEAFQDERIRLISLKKNSGVSFARNEALKVAHGEYVMFVDADDKISLDACEKFYQVSEKYNLDIMRGSYSSDENLFMKCGRTNELTLCVSDEMQRNYLVEGYYWGTKYKNIGALWGGIFRKEIMDNVWFDESLSMGEDTSFIYDLLKQNVNALRIGTSEDVFYFYRRDTVENSSTRNNLDKIYLDHVIQKIKWIELLHKANIMNDDLIAQLFMVYVFRIYSFFDKRDCEYRQHRKKVYDIFREEYRIKRKILNRNVKWSLRVFYAVFYLCPKAVNVLVLKNIRGEVI